MKKGLLHKGMQDSLSVYDKIFFYFNTGFHRQIKSALLLLYNGILLSYRKRSYLVVHQSLYLIIKMRTDITIMKQACLSVGT